MGTFTPKVKILQTNSNHARHAHNLLLQRMDERDMSLAIVAEPYRVPEGNPNWMGSSDGSVAIVTRRTASPIPCLAAKRGEGYVIARWGKVTVVGVYLSPRLAIAEVEERLDAISRDVRALEPAPLIVGGDFNAYSTVWGSRGNNARGRLVLDWAAAMNLDCLNQGRTSTCVRPQGESIVDLTWASPLARRNVVSWRVLSDVESLSDHVYIEMVMEDFRQDPTQGDGRAKRWSIDKLDQDLLVAAFLAVSWSRGMEPDRSLDDEVGEMAERLALASDVAMPRHCPRPRKATYWWSQSIHDLRCESIRKRRDWLRTRHKYRDPGHVRVTLRRMVYKEAKKALCKAISRAKADAWNDLLLDLDKNPWGMAYRIVREKIRQWSHPMTERLEIDFLDRVTNTLFPDPIPDWERVEQGETSTDEEIQWSEDHNISEEELTLAIRKIKKAAPGPDGIHGKVLRLAYMTMGSTIRSMYDRCLREGRFPAIWKRANLVLLHKDGKPEDSPGAYRPICLLDELGKTLERVLSARIVRHLEEAGPNLHKLQFGFRPGKSTNDAVLWVKRFVEGELREDRVVLAISLDIANAFNTLPWCFIVEALTRHAIPGYLTRIVKDYLSDRWINYRNRDGELCRRNIRRGVPQGSVLGPLLWNLGYNSVLAGVMLPQNCAVVCYADDTLLLAAGSNWREARSRGNESVAAVVGAIRELGLEVSPLKTEAVYFHDGGNGDPPHTEISVGGTPITVGSQLKYLGLQLDERWSFERHFTSLTPRVHRVMGQCCRMMPNIGGPGGKARRMFATVIHSVVLYGAPVWAEEASRSRKLIAILRGMQRTMAIRTIRGYRTVSHVAATILAGYPPLEMVAGMQAEIFHVTRSLRQARDGMRISPRESNTIRQRAALRMTAKWKAWVLNYTASGLRVKEALGNKLEMWSQRTWGHMTFRMTQLFTGHGCLGQYLHKIGREQTPECWHCDAGMDDAQHTLEACPAWANERAALTRVVGQDLSLSAITDKMLEREEAWSSMAKYCEIVMTRKEDDERERRGEAPRAEIAGRRRPVARRRRRQQNQPRAGIG